MKLNEITRYAALAGLLAGSVLTGCNDDGDNGNEGGGELEVPETYSFESAFVEGESSVAFSGQVFRHILIAELNSYIGGMTAAIDGGSISDPDRASLMAGFERYLLFDSSVDGEAALELTTDPATLQDIHNDVSSDKDLIGKLAGNDATTDHRNWTEGGFAGWSDASIADEGGSIETPEGLIYAFLNQIAANAADRINSEPATDPLTGDDLPVTVTETGLDLAQLTQKFLLGAIAFSQGVDDYLDDDVEGKGLLSPNTRNGDATYSTLEHQWDEGFGYFGASIYYGDFSDDQLAGGDTNYRDIDEDGSIDLLSEYNFGHSTNAAKRDRGVAEINGGTDFTQDAWDAFRSGRALIRQALLDGDGELSESELNELRGYRDDAVAAWEGAIAATVVHYINDTIEVLEQEDPSFLELAKVFSEMKGFALGLQFNRNSPILDDFDELHTLMGDSPALPNDDQAVIDAYIEDLLEARDLMAAAYGFDEEWAQGW